MDSFAFSGDDERVLERCQSVDFVVPQALERAQEATGQVANLLVPITFVRKWRLSQFSLRDESDRAIPLLTRSESTPIATAMLVSLARFVLGEEIDPKAQKFSSLYRSLVSIAADESVEALKVCISLADATDNASSLLSRDPTFMGLAYELARGFPLIALLPSEERRRRIVKYTYASYVLPARPDRRRIQIRHLIRAVHNRSWDLTETSAWDRRNEPPTKSGGTIVFSVQGDYITDGLQEGEHEPGIACALATVIAHRGRRRTIRLRPNSALRIDNLPLGEYEVRMEGASGFRVEAAPLRFQIKEFGDTEYVWVSARRTDVTARVTKSAARIAGRAWAGLRLTRWMLLNNKPLGIRVRLGHSGGYHCEFEAPQGMHVTRARLITDVPSELPPVHEPNWRGRELDVVLESKQRAVLDTHRTVPAAGYAYLHLRPRVDTIGRAARMSGFIATVVLFFVAYTWNRHTGYKHHGPPDASALLVVILGAPAALAAYLIQAIPSRVTTALLSGLRHAALLPSAFAIAAGAVMLVGEHRPWAHPALWILFGLAASTTAALTVTAYFAERPREQALGQQGPGFKKEYSVSPGTDDQRDAERRAPTEVDEATIDLRAQMLERAAGMSQHTRRTLLSQYRIGRRVRQEWRYQASPALYFDSAEIAPTFRGLPHEIDLRKLRMQVTAQARRITQQAPPH